MSTEIIPMVIDLSHWDPAYDYNAVVDDGIAGVIYKATEGVDYTDDTYVQQQQAAKLAGLLWGSYHFADGSSVSKQIDNYLRFACPDPDELFCLDWEDNGGNKMSRGNAQTWITEVENALKRPGQCVIYGGNTIKEALGNDVDPFFGARRLWLCQYGSSPTVQVSWADAGFWLWQYTDGFSGPTPHSVSGVGACDMNSYNLGDPERLAAEWASGKWEPMPAPPPKLNTVNVLVAAPPGVEVKVRLLGSRGPLMHTSRTAKEAK